MLGIGSNDTVTANSAEKSHITLGTGDNDAVTDNGGDGNTITLKDGNNDTVTALLTSSGSDGDTIKLGNGNNDTVFDSGFGEPGVTADFITVGNGNDTVHVGTNDTVTVGTGHDVLAFDWNPLSTVAPLNQGPDQSMQGGIGHVTITGFNPSNDLIVLQQFLAGGFGNLNIQEVSGNAVITIQGDTLDQITLVNVNSLALHQSNFHFV
jgi:hypothetical protein